VGPLTADGRPSGPAAGPPGPGTPDTGDGAAIGAEFPPPPAELYDFYRRARPVAPVFYAPSVDMWVATCYDDVLAVLRDGERFEKHENVPPSTLVPEAAKIVERIGMAPTFDLNPPEHTRVRRHINRAFTAQRVNRMEPVIARMADDLLTGIEPAGRADIVDGYFFPLPARIIFDMMGVPAADLRQVGDEWSRAFVELFFSEVPEDRQVACAQANLEYWEYCVELVEDRRRRPRQDLVSALLAPAPEGDAPLTTAEIVSLCAVLVVAGHENTTRMLANTLLLLLQDRRRWEALVTDPGGPAGAAAAVEETLRYESPLNGLWYYARRDVELGGAHIPEGGRVFASFAAANHDETYFADPDTWDLDRPATAKHLTFGAGIHSCFGASLARLTGRVAVETLARRLPSLRMEDQPLDWVPMFVPRGVQSLLVAWDAAGDGDQRDDREGAP
jgi:cytochrome P450